MYNNILIEIIWDYYWEKNDISLDDKNLIKIEYEIDRKYWCREDYLGKLIYVLMILRDLRLIVFGGKVWKGWGWGLLEEGIFNGGGGVIRVYIGI